MKRLFLICLVALAFFSCDKIREVVPQQAFGIVNQKIVQNGLCEAGEKYNYTYHQDNSLSIRREDIPSKGDIYAKTIYIRKGNKMNVYQIVNQDSFLIKTAELNEKGYIEKEFSDRSNISIFSNGNFADRGKQIMNNVYSYDAEGYLMSKKMTNKVVFESGKEEDYSTLIIYKTKDGNLQSSQKDNDLPIEYAYFDIINPIGEPENMYYGKPNKNLIKAESIGGYILTRYQYENTRNILKVTKAKSRTNSFNPSICTPYSGSIELIEYQYFTPK